MEAFRYPPEPHIRRHGPRGYLRTESFRPWLRDEFSFRCIYCLLREQWGRSKGVFGVDHFLAVACFPDEELEYDNLLYCCTTCNAAKGKRRLPRPEDVLVAGDIHIDEDGSMTGRSFQARQLIRVLGLDDTEYREFRVLWSEIIDLAKTHDAQVYRKLVGYPAKLPNLAVLRPPRGIPDRKASSYRVFPCDGRAHCRKFTDQIIDALPAPQIPLSEFAMASPALPARKRSQAH